MAAATPDIELNATVETDNSPKFVSGYPLLAYHIGQAPQAAIFRVFDALTAKTLLYLQAEIIQLEKELYDCELRDSENGENGKNLYAISWAALSSASAPDDQQYKLVMKLRGLLEQHHKMILRVIKLHRYGNVDTADLKWLQGHLRRGGYNAQAVAEGDFSVWGTSHKPDECIKDIISLIPSGKRDFFSTWVNSAITWCYEKSRSPKSKRVIITKENTVYVAIHCLNSIMAALVPTLAMVILPAVHAYRLRLLAMILLYILLACLLLVLTSATRAEMFAILTAFATILVVFVVNPSYASGGTKSTGSN